MKLEPTLDRVAIRRTPKEKTTKGGIILPEQAKKETNFGYVVAVGPGGFNQDGTRRPMSIKKGDCVFFTDYHTTDAGDNVIGDIVIVDEEDVLAIGKA